MTKSPARRVEAQSRADLRSTIFGAQDLKKELITVPDWGNVTIELRGLSGAKRAEVLEKSTVRTTDDRGQKQTYQDQGIFYPLMVVAACFDPMSGQPLFDDTDVEQLNEKSAGVLEDVALAAAKLSGITPDTQSVVKNSETTPSASSSSDSSSSSGA